MNQPNIALVTGASRGIGRSAALALARAGAHVIVTYREGAAGADETVRLIEAAGGEAIALPLDIGEPASFGLFTSGLLEQIQQRWGRHTLDILVNNAGIGLFGRLEEVTVEQVDLLLHTNVRGTFFLIQALAPHLASGGRIISISSSLTRHMSPGTSVYAASKAAIEVLSRSLAVELGPREIRMNVVAPGPSATDFNGGAMRDNSELRGVLAAHTALGRVGHSDEIGDAIAALATNEMRWVTAERLEVSGGVFL